MVEKIGIIGGGQLGRMLTEAAHPLGFDVTVLDPVPNCPAAQVGAQQIVAGLKDGDAIAELVKSSHVTTWEIEHVDSVTLGALADAGHNIQPEPSTLRVIQDKLKQKQYLASLDLPVAAFAPIGNERQLEDAVCTLGQDMFVKSALGAYDGRGNLEYSGASLAGLRNELGDDLYGEKRVPFEKELSVIAARSMAGRIATYPTVETVHKDSICHTVLAPADIDPSVDSAAQEIAHETMRYLNGAGVFAIEMFAADKDVIINEIAPRVHNSGHHTIEAAQTSQFEQHIRAITGMPLGSTEMRAPAAVMINILGKRAEPLTRQGLDGVLALPDTHPHFYGKSSRRARKIGHITVLGSSLREALRTAEQARSELVV
jgi:phosphoribosylaminoimidazole carboxylase